MDAIEQERQRRLNKAREASSVLPDEDPIERVRREMRERNQRLVARQHEQHVRTS